MDWTAIRSVFNGESAAAVVTNATLEFAVATGWFPIAALTMDHMADGGRRNGSIELIR